MRKPLIQLGLLAVLASTTACSFAVRDAETYRADTRALLDTKNAEIKQCYDQVLQTNQAAAGTVTVSFKVAAETGQITEPTVVPEQSTAPPELGQCVVQAISGLALQPPDQNDGIATYSYEFNAGAPGATAPAGGPPPGPAGAPPAGPPPVGAPPAMGAPPS